MSQSSPKRRGNKKVVEPTPEPEVTVKEGSDQNVPLLISANADALVYELGSDSIKLKSTMMFQTRAFSFPFKNTSTVPLEFSWLLRRTAKTRGRFQRTTALSLLLCLTHLSWNQPRALSLPVKALTCKFTSVLKKPGLIVVVSSRRFLTLTRVPLRKKKLSLWLRLLQLP